MNRMIDVRSVSRGQRSILQITKTIKKDTSAAEWYGVITGGQDRCLVLDGTIFGGCYLSY
jgi:hypothetical protein